MLISWIVFPAVASLVCLGIGLAVDRLASCSIRPVLWLPVGFTGLVCLSQLTTSTEETSRVTVPVVLAVSLAGWIAGRSRLGALGSAWPAAVAAAGVFVVSGLPVMATGTPSFAGYTVLGDTAAHLAGAAEIPTGGRAATDLEPSNYASTFRTYYTLNAYPSGGPVAVGTLARVVAQDPAWVFQPFLSFVLAMLVLALAGLVEPLARRRWIAAAVGFCAGQSATLIAFAMQGGVKEIGVSAAFATLSATIPDAVKRDADWRAAFPLPIAAGAAIGILGPSAVLWVGPMLVVALVLALRSGRSWRSAVGAFVCVALVGLIAVAQTASVLDTATNVATSVASAAEVGNLLRPLDTVQALGVWLTGDFRVAPTGLALLVTRALEVLIVVGALLGVAWAVSRRAWIVLAYSGTLVVGAAVVIVRGSPWADAKALAIVSPGLLLLATVGFLGQAERHRIVAVAGAATVALGVLVSNALIYRSASVAPYDRLQELAEINRQLDGEGPVLFTEFDEFAPYLLRDARPEPAPLLIVSPGDQGQVGRGAATDVDGMTTVDLARYPVVVTRVGPIGSRPSSVYRTVGRTEHYAVWRRAGDPARILAHVAMGPTPRRPVASKQCSLVRGVASQARRAKAKLVFAVRPAPVVANPARRDTPAGWRKDPDDPGTTLPSGGGSASQTVEIQTPGRYDVWLEASVGRSTEVRVDGRRIGGVRNRLAGRRVSERLGAIRLGRGEHVVTVARASSGVAPGAGGLFRPLGPVYLVPSGGTALHSVAPQDWKQWCGRSLDWVEAVV